MRCWRSSSRSASVRPSYLEDPTLVRNVVADGCEKARKLAQETLREVKQAMGLDYT